MADRFNSDIKEFFSPNATPHAAQRVKRPTKPKLSLSDVTDSLNVKPFQVLSRKTQAAFFMGMR